MFSKAFFLTVIKSWYYYYYFFFFFIVWCLRVLSTVFQSYCVGQCIHLCFPGVLLTSTPHSILSKPLAAYPHKTVVKTMDSLKRGINPVTTTIINLKKEYLPSHGSNQSSIVWKRVKMPEPSKELWLLWRKLSQIHLSNLQPVPDFSPSAVLHHFQQYISYIMETPNLFVCFIGFIRLRLGLCCVSSKDTSMDTKCA